MGSHSTFFLVSEVEVCTCWKSLRKLLFYWCNRIICGWHIPTLLSALNRTQYLKFKPSSYNHKEKPKIITDTLALATVGYWTKSCSLLHLGFLIYEKNKPLFKKKNHYKYFCCYLQLNTSNWHMDFTFYCTFWEYHSSLSLISRRKVSTFAKIVTKQPVKSMQLKPITRTFELQFSGSFLICIIHLQIVYLIFASYN